MKLNFFVRFYLDFEFDSVDFDEVGYFSLIWNLIWSLVC